MGKRYQQRGGRDCTASSFLCCLDALPPFSLSSAARLTVLAAAISLNSLLGLGCVRRLERNGLGLGATGPSLAVSSCLCLSLPVLLARSRHTPGGSLCTFLKHAYTLHLFLFLPASPPPTPPSFSPLPSCRACCSSSLASPLPASPVRLPLRLPPRPPSPPLARAGQRWPRAAGQSAARFLVVRAKSAHYSRRRRLDEDEEGDRCPVESDEDVHHMILWVRRSWPFSRAPAARPATARNRTCDSKVHSPDLTS